MFNRQQKTITTKTVQGSSSSSSSTVTRTFITTSTTFHSDSSSDRLDHCQTSKNTESPTVLDAIKRIEKLNINQPSKSNTIISRKENCLPSKRLDTVPKSTAENYEKFQLDCLNAHNDYRRKHGVEPLKLSPTLSNFAQNWANTIANKRQMQHSSERKYGENIYWSSGKGVNGKVPVDAWYDEIKQYSYKNASFSSATGHFTQVVWKNSCELGVGMACVGNEVYVVASYYPPGNYSGEFSKNVLSPK